MKGSHKLLTSPVVITIDGVAHSLSRINNDNFGSTYLKKAAGLEIRLNVRHSYEKAGVNGQYERHNIDLTHTTWDTEGKPTVTQVYEVIRPLRGTDGSLASKIAVGLNAFIATNGTAIVGWES